MDTGSDVSSDEVEEYSLGLFLKLASGLIGGKVSDGITWTGGTEGTDVKMSSVHSVMDTMICSKASIISMCCFAAKSCGPCVTMDGTCDATSFQV